MTLHVRFAVRSDRGLVRDNNEDSVYAGPRLLAIADGMGGHAGGEVASQVVIGVIERLDEDRPLDDLIVALRDAVDDANVAVAESVAREPQLDGMGTTLTALRFVDSRVGVVHVGDSRAYLLRDGRLTQITRDDTYVQSLVDAGRITAEEATTHPRKSVILRAMTGATVEPDLSIREVRPNDRYLLCTDGLTDVVSEQTLRETLLEGTPQECADQLVALALRGGGPDNVTCIVAQISDDGYGDDLPVVAGAVAGEGSLPSAGLLDTPAGRASATRSAPPPAPPAVPARARRRRRPLIIVGIVVVVLIGSALGLYHWTQQQYYVGVQNDRVAIFRGVDAQIGPWKLYSVIERTSLDVDDLTEAARGQVRSRIDAMDRSDAEGIVARLSGNLLPLCPAPSPTPTITPTAGTPSAPTPTPTPTPGAPTPTPTPGEPLGPTTAGSTTAGTTSAGSTSAGTPQAGASGGSTFTAPSSDPNATPVPGVDCRVP